MRSLQGLRLRIFFNGKNLMNTTKEKEKEKKQKLKQLEAEIKEMQRDHKETFAVMNSPVLERKKTDAKPIICAAVGVIILAAAMIWLYLYPPVFDRYAVFRIGTLRFTRSVFFLPFMISTLATILCKKRKKYIVSFLPSAVIAVIGAALTMNAEQLLFPVWVYVIAYCCIFIGIGLLLLAKYKKALNK